MIRPTKSTQQIKEEQINFLLEDVEKNVEEYRKAIDIKDKQLPEAKKLLQTAIKSYDSLVNKNKKLKEFMENIKQQQQKKRQQQC